MDERMQSCCFSGHRVVAYADLPDMRRRLRETLQGLYLGGVRQFYAGGALGFDTLAAQEVLALREAHPDVRLVLALPCPTQNAGWRDGDAALYEYICAHADEVVCVSDRYTPDCMFARNRYMVDRSCVCVCYLRRVRGGTAYTVNYAARSGVKIINLAQ